MKILIYNANLILYDEIFWGYLLIDHDKIVQIGPGMPDASITSEKRINADGQYLSPGFVELHSHGAGGADFMDGTPEAFITAASTHLQHGTTTLLPTTMSAPFPELEQCIEAFISVLHFFKDGPHMPGLHLEGPYLNPLFKGAMEESQLHTPDPTEYVPFMEKYGTLIKRWTIAPELPGAMKMADYLAQYSILLSVGHSAAEYAVVKEAVRHGYSHVTHLFSSMSSITRRNGFRITGLLESALLLDSLTVEIIADGCHIPSELLRGVWQHKGADHICLTCDSMRCAGTNLTNALLGSNKHGVPVFVEDGVAKLVDCSGFAGSIATDDQLVRIMHKKANVPLVDCIRMMSTTPARILGINHFTGSIACGKQADLVLFDNNINIDTVFVAGKIAFQK